MQMPRLTAKTEVTLISGMPWLWECLAPQRNESPRQSYTCSVVSYQPRHGVYQSICSFFLILKINCVCVCMCTCMFFVFVAHTWLSRYICPVTVFAIRSCCCFCSLRLLCSTCRELSRASSSPCSTKHTSHRTATHTEWTLSAAFFASFQTLSNVEKLN